jgi:hypothetical protein
MKQLAGIVLLLAFALPGAQGQEAAGKKRGGKLSALLEELADGADPAPLAALRRLRFQGAGEKAEVSVIVEPAAKGSHSIDRGLLARLGGTVEASSRSYLRVRVKPAALRALAGHPGVRAVRGATAAKALGLGNPSGAEALTGADAWHAAGQTGAGVKVAVVDLGFIGLAARKASGELPASTVGVDFSGTGLEADTSHGTGVAEHVADMAPGAEIHCLKVGDEVDLQNAADYCAANGIRVANHSVGWVNSSYYDDSGPINAIVNESRDADGVFWCVAAGNDRTAHWRGGWSDPDADNKLNFTAADELMDLTTASSVGYVFLNWNQYGNSLTDLDLYVRNKNNTVVAQSAGSQTGTQDPAEAVAFNYNPNLAPYRIEVRWYSGPKTGLDLTIFSFYNDLEHAVGSSSLMDPADAHGAFSVAAIDRAVYALASPPAEPFSSMGPTNDGRPKPDLAAPDGTSSQTYGTDASYGTSFASPTTAGAAALLLGQDPALTAVQLGDLLRTWAVDAGPAGADSEFGAGKLALQPPGPPPSNRAPTANPQTVTTAEGDAVAITLTGSDPDGDPLTYAISSAPLLGSLSGTPPAVTYTPGAAGTDTFTFTATDDEGLSSPPAVVTVKVLKTMHVASISMSTQRSNRNYRAISVVTVVDKAGVPVPGVSVNGSWSGVVSGAQTQSTNASGQATFTSGWKKSKGPFTFTVTGASLLDWVYKSGENFESSDSITAP